MLNNFLKYPKLLAFALGLATVAALPPYYWFPVLFITFSGLLLLINRAPTSGQAFKIGYAFGFAFYALGFSWIGNALLIDAASFGWLYPLVIIACGSFFGLFIAFPAWVSWYFRTLTARWLAFAAWWVIFEWIRSWFLTGFPWNLLGSVLAFSDSLLQFASVTGTYGLSFLVLLSTSAPALYFHYRNRRAGIISVLIPLIILSFLYIFGSWRIAQAPVFESDINLRLVQPAIPQIMKWDEQVLEQNFKEYIRLSQLPGQDQIDFTVWGETASPFPLDLDPQHAEEIIPAVPPHGYLVTGLVRYQFDRHSRYDPYNSMFILDSAASVKAYYDKAHLVPFGEYIPLREYLPKWIRPIANVIGTFKSGPGPQVINLPGYPPLGGLICYEVIFPHEIIEKTQRPDWIINLTNDGWYGDSAGPYQHLVSARLRAVEEGIAIVRSANTGISAVISPLGIVTASLGLSKSGIVDAKLPLATDFSTTYGNNSNAYTLIWCFLILSLAFYLSFRSLYSQRI